MFNVKGHVLSFDDSPIGLNTPLDSTTYNKIIDSLKTSVLRCINRSRDLDTKVTKFNKALVAENLYLQAKIAALNIDHNAGTKGAIITGFDSITSSSDCVVNKLTGQVTMAPITGRKWSKIPRYSDSNGRLRASKDVYITLDSIAMPQNSDIYNMLDGYADTFWLLDTSVYTESTVRIQFPTSIKPYVNYFSLVPFPAFGFNIKSLAITKADGTVQNLVDYNIITQECGVMDVHFKPISWGGTVEMVLQSKGDVIGISDIDIGLIDYVDSQCSAIFEIPSFKDITFDYIDSVDLMDFGLVGSNVEDNGYDRSKDSVVNIYVNDFTTANKISEDTLYIYNDGTSKGLTKLTATKAVGEKVYIELKFKKYLAQSPIFRSAKIKVS